MTTTLVSEIDHSLDQVGLTPDFGPDRSRLMVQVLRTLACGRPVTMDQVDQMAAGLGMPSAEASQFLNQVCEWDAEGNIIGAMGLSLTEQWDHRFYVNGIPLRTWCARDALFLPPILNRTASIVSFSPRSGREVRLAVSPHQVEWCHPEGAAVSIVGSGGVGPDATSVEAVWTNFCDQVHFFPSRQEAEEWAVGKESISIFSVEEAYELAKRAFSSLLAYA